MNSLRMSSLVALSLCLLTFGCSSGLKNENAGLRRENQELKARVNDLQTQANSAPSPQQLQALQNEIAQRDQKIRELEAQLRNPTPGGNEDPGIAGIETSYDRKKGELTVNLPADILFAPGSCELKTTSKTTLNKVISALKRDYASKKVRVEGHTDTDKITRSKDKWIDNLDLSVNRAAVVTRYLVENGVAKSNIATVGHGDTRPKASKAASRRVEIIVVVG